MDSLAGRMQDTSSKAKLHNQNTKQVLTSGSPRSVSMIDCSKKRNLSNDEYVRYQFNCTKLNAFYKNAFIHTSLLEGLIVSNSEQKEPHISQKCECCGRVDNFRSIRKALNILKPEIDDGDGNWELLQEIFDKRNDLAHDFVILNQNAIESKIKEIWKMILHLYTNSGFINKCFEERYGFEPKTIITKRDQAELEQDS